MAIPKPLKEPVREALARNQEIQALRLAARYRFLGKHKERILTGANALMHPDFYKELGRDPDALVEDGIRACRERFVEEQR